MALGEFAADFWDIGGQYVSPGVHPFINVHGAVSPVMLMAKKFADFTLWLG